MKSYPIFKFLLLMGCGGSFFVFFPEKIESIEFQDTTIRGHVDEENETILRERNSIIVEGSDSNALSSPSSEGSNFVVLDGPETRIAPIINNPNRTLQ